MRHPPIAREVVLVIVIALTGCSQPGSVVSTIDGLCPGVPGSTQACETDMTCPVGTRCYLGCCAPCDQDASELCDGQDNNCNRLVDEGGRLDCQEGDTCSGGICECDARVRDCECRPDAVEVCDSKDNDCDGEIDEGLMNACGNCLADCVVEDRGTGTGHAFDPPSAGGGLVQNDDGSITLQHARKKVSFAWPSNSSEGTISRIDTERNVEVGRYATVLRQNGLPVVPEWNAGRNMPSRSTVDRDGNAYVANRAHGGVCYGHTITPTQYAALTPGYCQGSVTKIGLYEKDRCDLNLDWCNCVDRNHDNQISTSQDLDGNGIEKDDPLEFLGYDDECLLWTTPIPGPPAYPQLSNARAMAIDANGFIWVGDWDNLRFYKLDPETGAIVDPVPERNQNCSVDPYALCSVAVGGRPYGAVVFNNEQHPYGGLLWYHAGSIQAVDTRTGEVRTPMIVNPVGAYGITVDALGHVWLTSTAFGNAQGKVGRFDPEIYFQDPTHPENFWHSYNSDFTMTDTQFIGRGLTSVSEDNGQSGTIWATFHDYFHGNNPNAGGAGVASFITGFDMLTGAVVKTVNLKAACGATYSHGVGIGTGGSVWTVNGSNSICRYDPVSDADALHVVKIPIGAGPYTYSDFTGNVSGIIPTGAYSTLYTACQDNAEANWLSLQWSANTPGLSRIEIRMKVAASLEMLRTAPVAVEAAQPGQTSLDLTAEHLRGNYAEIEFLLKADPLDSAAPVLNSFNMVHRCVLLESVQ